MRQPTGMKVPLVDLGAQYDTIRDEVVAAVTRVCDSQRFILGPEVELVEKELAEYLSAKHAVGMSSGTDALLAIMMGLGVGPGDGNYHRLFVLRGRGLHRPAWCHSGIRRHQPGHLQH